MLCKTIGQDYYFFPGGSSNEGESSEQILVREIQEEFSCGVINIKLLTTIHNKFTSDKEHNETISMYTGELADKTLYSKQKMKLADGSDIVAEWIEQDDIKDGKVKILPTYDYLGLIGAK